MNHDLEENSCRNHESFWQNERNHEYQDSNDSASTPNLRSYLTSNSHANGAIFTPAWWSWRPWSRRPLCVWSLLWPIISQVSQVNLIQIIYIFNGIDKPRLFATYSIIFPGESRHRNQPLRNRVEIREPFYRLYQERIKGTEKASLIHTLFHR